ncbi:hypothetical protein AU467_30335 [Mesorhizobium loti]|uniref:Uncharacterized protein n=1 Tax=Rhizobium loti TaxID=381 RepID=A0A101KPA3_RHILI|nr:hypothetical protein AU467_30335 [Mesorhizobium loti]
MAQRIRWNAAYLTYRWAKRRSLRLARQLGAVEVERERVLQILARPRRITHVHVLSAASRLQPLHEREFALLGRWRRMREWIRLARVHALAARRVRLTATS